MWTDCVPVDFWQQTKGTTCKHIPCSYWASSNNCDAQALAAVDNRGKPSMTRPRVVAARWTCAKKSSAFEQVLVPGQPAKRQPCEGRVGATTAQLWDMAKQTPMYLM
jgi:hypothetical protein